MHHSRPTPTSRTVRVKPVSLLTIIIGEMIVVLMVLLFSSEPALTTSLVGLDQGEDFTLPRLYPQLKSSARSKEPRPAQNISTGHVSQHPAINSTKISKAPALSSNGTISSKSSSTPSANTTLTTTTKRPPNLITRTTDAIYKVLTGYFSHDDDEEEEEGGEQKADDQGFGDKLTTTVQPSSTKVPAKEHNDHKDQRQTQEHQIHQVNQKPQQQQQDAKNHKEHRQPELHQEHKDHRQDQAHKQHHDNQKPQQQQQDAKNNNEHRKPEPHQEHKEHHDLKHNDHEQTEQHQDANSHKQQGHKDHQDQEHQKHHGNQKPQQQQQDAKNHNEHRQPERHQEHNDHEQAEQHQDARSHKQHQQHQDHNGHKIHEGQHEHYDHGQPQQHQDAKDRGDHQHHEQQRDNMGHKDHQENRPHHDHQHHQEPEKYQKPDEHKDNHKQHKQHQDHNGHKIHEDHERQREHYDHGQSQQHQDAKDHGDHQHPEQHQDNMDHKDHQENRLLHDHQHHQESQQYQEPNEHRDSKQQHQQHQQDHRDQKTHKDHATKITSQSPMSLTTVKIVPVVTTTPHPAIKPATTHVTVRTSRAPVTSGTTRKMNTTSAGIPMDTTTTMSVDSKPMPVNHTNKSSPTTATTSSKLNRTTRKEGTDATHTTATMTPEWGPTATATTTMRPKLSLPPHFHLNFSDQNYTTTTTPADGHYNHSTGKLFDHYHHHHQHHQPEHHKTTIKEEATSLYQTLAPNITNTASPTLAPTLPTTAITTIPSRQASTGDIVANQDYQEVRLNSSTATFASSSIHLFGLLSRAFTSISSELTYLNRTTRLAPDKLDTTEEGDEIDSALEHGGREIENSPRIEHNAANWSSLANQIGDKPSHSRASDRLSNLRTGPTGVGSSDDSPEAASGGSKQQQVATASREDILLLCKLLHKHLDQSSSSLSFKNSTSLNTQLNDELNLHGLGKNSAQLADSTSKPANDTATTTLKPPPAKQQPDDIGHHELDSNLDQRWLVSEPNAELNELQHGERLLETEFVIERRDSGSPGGKPGAGQSHHESHYEEAGLRLLSELYNLGQASRMAAASGASTGSTSSDEPVEVGGGLVASKNISLFVWSKTEGRGGRLRLVYWLLEQLRPSLASRSRPDGGSTIANTAKAAVRFRVLELAEALELLDQLDHSLVQQTINEAGLVRPRGVLVTSYKRERELTAAGGPPRVIDDSLHMDQQGTGSSGSGSKSPSTLQLIIDRFSQASFGENFHLYLILFVVILFIIILCFAIPALCCKCMTPASSTSTSASSLVTGSNSTNNRPNRGGGHLRRNLRDNGRARPGASKPPPEDNTRRGPARRGFYRSTDPLRQSITSISGALAAGTANSRSEEGRQFDAIGKLDDTPAIWRKLSNSTTTMTKDEICTREDDGQLELVRNNNNRLDDESGEYSGQFMPASKTSDGSKFEWYTFEDNKEQAIRHHGGLAAAPRDFRDQESRNNKSTTGQQRQVVNKPAQTMVVHDKFRLTKSVQTYARAEHLLDGAQRAAAPWAEASGTGGDEIKRDGGEPLLNTMAYRDRLETRNSNTLTKSELVMLKEKLIPIGQQLRESAEHDNTKQQQRAMVIDHDYVNTAATTTTGSSSQQQRPSHQQPVVTKPPSRHIDSSSVEESTNGDRTRGRSPGESFAEQQPKRSPSEDAAASANSQRAPSMRYLELPSHAQGKVDAIKTELGKLEARDSSISSRYLRQARAPHHEPPGQDSAGTYKRYDVI